MYRGNNQGGRQKFFARQSMTPRKDRMMNIATRFKYRMHLNCHDERQVGFDGACRDDSISSNSYCPYPTLSKYGSLLLPENSNSDVSNCGGSRFFIPHWQADSRNKTEKIKAHYDRDVKTILENGKAFSHLLIT